MTLKIRLDNASRENNFLNFTEQNPYGAIPLFHITEFVSIKNKVIFLFVTYDRKTKIVSHFLSRTR